jgi:hypothetical protein
VSVLQSLTAEMKKGQTEEATIQIDDDDEDDEDSDNEEDASSYFLPSAMCSILCIEMNSNGKF